jgi:hypothetical protein
MPILKHIEETGYVQIPNILAQNTNLSYEAIGILVNLLSRPKDWRIYKISFKKKGCGDVVLNRIFNELQTSGYLFMQYIMENNKIIDKIWVVSSHPIYDKDPDKQKKMWLKVLDDQSARKPMQLETNAIGNHELQIKNNTNKEIKEKHKKEISYSEVFLDTWEKIFPHPTIKGSKPQSYKNWCSLLKEGYTEQELLNYAKNWKYSRELNKLTYSYNCSNFYGEKRYFEGFITVDKPIVEEFEGMTAEFDDNGVLLGYRSNREENTNAIS